MYSFKHSIEFIFLQKFDIANCLPLITFFICLTFAKTWIWWVSSTPFEFLPRRALNSYPFWTKPRPCIIQVSKCPLLRTYPNKNAQTDRHATLSEKWARQIGNWDSIRVSYLPILYIVALLYMDRNSDGQQQPSRVG